MGLGSVKARNMALDACYGASKSSVWPATVYAHLYVGDPTSGATELTAAGGYAPAAVTNNGTNFPAASGGQKANGATWSFPQSTGAWSGVATYLWLTDALGCVPPGAPTVTVVGTAGSTAYSYQVTAVNSAGETTPSGAGSTASGNATLSGTNYNTVAWSAVSGATSYNVYKAVGGVWKLLATGVTGTSYNDTGGATTSTTPPTTNTTSNLLDGGPLASPVIVTKAGVVVELPANSVVIGS